MNIEEHWFFIKITPLICIFEIKNNTDLFNKFQSLQAHLKTSIEESKQNSYLCLSNKLLDSKNNSQGVLVYIKDLSKW